MRTGSRSTCERALRFAHITSDAYERLLVDVIRGSQQLFMRRDEVDAAGTRADPIFDAWSRSSQPMSTYSAGVWGPSAAVALIERDGRTWHE